MLAVASDRFPRTGAIAISIMGGLGMMSAGLIGSAGLGYSKDRFTAKELQPMQPAVYDEFKGSKPSSFLFFESVLPVDGLKLGSLTKRLNEERDKISREGGDRDLAIGNVLSESERTVYEARLQVTARLWSQTRSFRLPWPLSTCCCWSICVDRRIINAFT